jgi:hypothetical protein
MSVFRAFKSVLAKERPIETVDPYPSISVMAKQLVAAVEHHIPSEWITNVSELYAKASLHVTNLVQEKTQGEMLFMGAIITAVVLFVVVLPACEALRFSRSEKAQPSCAFIKSTPSSNSSSTESLNTIEESEDEDARDEPAEDVILDKSIELPEGLSFADNEEEAVYEAEDLPLSLPSKDEADDKQSDITPVNEGLETPVSSPPVSPGCPKPELTKEFASTPTLTSTPKRRSSLAKLKGKMSSSRISFRRKASSDDASVGSTGSFSSFRKFSLKSKKE